MTGRSVEGVIAQVAGPAEGNAIVLLLGAGGVTAVATLVAQLITGRRTGDLAGRQLQADQWNAQAKQWADIVRTLQAEQEDCRRRQEECLRREEALRRDLEDVSRGRLETERRLRTVSGRLERLERPSAPTVPPDDDDWGSDDDRRRRL